MDEREELCDLVLEHAYACEVANGTVIVCGENQAALAILAAGYRKHVIDDAMIERTLDALGLAWRISESQWRRRMAAALRVASERS